MSEKRTEILGGVDTHRHPCRRSCRRRRAAVGDGVSPDGPANRVVVVGRAALRRRRRHRQLRRRPRPPPRRGGCVRAGGEPPEPPGAPPARQVRPADAEAAARAVLADDATAVPKAGNGPVEAIRMLTVARRSTKARTGAHNQIHNLLVTGAQRPAQRPPRRRPHRRLRPPARAAAARRRQDGAAQPRTTPPGAQRRNRRPRRRTALCAAANPALLAAHGVGPDTAAALLIAAGDNPQRLHSEPASAASPIAASSGQTVRHRLNRRRPPRQPSPLAHRHGPLAQRPPHPGLRRAPPQGKTNHPLPQTLHRPRNPPPPHQPATGPPRTRPATNAQRHSTQHPTPAASAPSNEAPPQPPPSPPTTTPGSPPLDKHRSTGAKSPTGDVRGGERNRTGPPRPSAGRAGPQQQHQSPNSMRSVSRSGAAPGASVRCGAWVA